MMKQNCHLIASFFMFRFWGCNIQKVWQYVFTCPFLVYHVDDFTIKSCFINLSFRRLCESAAGRATSSRFQPRIFATDCFINTNEIFSNFLQRSSECFHIFKRKQQWMQELNGEKPVELSKYTLCTVNKIIQQTYFFFQKNVQYSPTLPNDYNRLKDIQLLNSNCISFYC